MLLGTKNMAGTVSPLECQHQGLPVIGAGYKSQYLEFMPLVVHLQALLEVEEVLLSVPQLDINVV